MRSGRQARAANVATGVALLAAALIALAAVAPPARAAYFFDFKWGTVGTGNGQFNDPNGISVNSSGDVYVADTSNNRIQKFDSSGAFVTKWGVGSSGAGQFSFPYAVAADDFGNVYVADTWNHRVQKFNPTGSFLRAWGWGVKDGTSEFQICTSLDPSCQGGISGPGDGQMNAPTGIAVDSLGNVYVTDSGNNRVQKFTESGVFVKKWGGPGSGDGLFSTPFGAAADSGDNIYVSDASGTDRIQKFTSAGTFLTKWGSTGSGDGEFSVPYGVASDGSDIFVADSGNNRIQKFTGSGTFLTKWGSSGLGEGEFSSPRGVAVSGSGDVYVADSVNDRIQVFTEVPPDTQIDSGPSGLINDNTPTFTFSADQGGSSFECRIDSGAFAACTSPHTTAILPDGPHDLYVRAVNGGTPDPTPAMASITVDTTPPQTTIDSAPADPSNDPSPGFSFSSTETADFECELDSTAEACTSPHAIGPLADGAHSFEVAATDQAGNTDPTPATYSWTVDTSAPAKPTFDSTDPASPANDNNPKILGAAEAGSTVKLYSSNDCSGPAAATGTAAEFASPGLPATVTDDSTTSFHATATDPASNTSACSSESIDYNEDSTAPQTMIDSGPSGLINDTSAAFAFSSNEPGAGFACRLDAAAFASCASPSSYSALPDGPHAFSVRAIDAAGNIDPTAATRSFTVDTAVAATATAKAKQRQKRSKVYVKVKVSVEEAAAAALAGKLKIAGRSYKLKPMALELKASETRKLKLKPKRSKDRDRILAALKKGKSARARVTADFTDEAGNEEGQKLRVKLKR